MKLRAVLDTLGEDDETNPTIFKAALQKAEVQAQERPISEQIRITKMFISRKQKRVEQTRLETEKAKEVLSRAQKEQVEQEALLADGERRLEALLAKEKVLPSPFSNHTECPGRVQQVARDYRQSAARTRTPSVWGAFVSHIAGRRRRHGGRSPLQENQGGITDPCSYQWLYATVWCLAGGSPRLVVWQQVRRGAVASGVGWEFPAGEAPFEALFQTSPFWAKWQARGQVVRVATGQVSSTLGQVACRSGSPSLF